MTTPYIGEIRIFSFNFAPRGWATCAGQLLPIAQNQALFSILGTTYGGNGIQNFALPDLRGRAPIHFGQGTGLANYALGQSGGTEAQALTVNQVPGHTHTVTASSNPADVTSPANAFWADGGVTAYSATPTTTLSPAALSSSGQSVGHENRSPFLTLNICIALTGVFPSRN
jgi:microcystin-dependent protein